MGGEGDMGEGRSGLESDVAHREARGHAVSWVAKRIAHACIYSVSYTSSFDEHRHPDRATRE